jgi:hypothetical protein
MSAAIALSAFPCSSDETLDAILAPTHDAWVQEARQLLAPASAPGAPSWERWPVVRWLNERFLRRFQAERALVNELRPLMTVREEEMVDSGQDRIARLQVGLDRIARRRGSAAEFAAVAEEFLRALEMWCAENELAAHRIRCRSLTRETRRVLEEVEAASGVPLRM